MYQLRVTRGHETFIFEDCSLDILIQFAGDWDTAVITDPDGDVVYALEFPEALKFQAC